MLGTRYNSIDPSRPTAVCRDREAYAGWLFADLFARAQGFRTAFEAIEQSGVDAEDREQALLALGRVLAIDLAEAEARARDANLLHNEDMPLMLQQVPAQAANWDRRLEERRKHIPPAFVERLAECRQLARDLEAAGVGDTCVGHLLRAVDFAEVCLEVVGGDP